MESVVYWNVVDGYAYLAEPGDFSAGQNRLAGGLMHFDMTPKKALIELDKLFNEEWNTSETLTSDKTGKCSFKGFYGNYEVQIISNGKSYTKVLTLSKNKSKNFDIII